MANKNYYYLIEKSLNYLSLNYGKNPSLKELADYVSLSEFHFQRVFKNWAGISPKQFIQYLKKENAVQILVKSRNILDASSKLKLSSQSRLYDLFVTIEAVTPGEYRSYGKDLDILYGFHETIFGKCLIGITERGICHLSFIVNNENENLNVLNLQWKEANLIKDENKTLKAINQLFPNEVKKNQKIKLFLKGTNFQLKVWEALINIPPGYLLSYEDVAKKINNKKATRAVASAVAKNPVAYLIPCHRVIKKIGQTHKYRWGNERKMAIIGYEQAKRAVP